MIQELAVHRFGALGTICYPNFHGKYPEEKDAVTPLPIWPWADKVKEPTFGFNLSEQKGLWLRSLVEKGTKVVVSGKIDTGLVSNGAYELPTAVIPGTEHPEEEFIFYAHLDHSKPGTHDNASGSAVLLEIARTLSSLIQRNILPPPKRTIRFMWVPHMSGPYMYFLNHPEKAGKVRGGCNLDCVAANPVKYPLQFFVALPSPSLPSFLTDIGANLVNYMNQKITNAIHTDSLEDFLFAAEGSRNMFSVTLTPYQGVSDEELAATWPLAIPSLYFYDSPLPPRHSQINFLDYIDPTDLRRVSYLGSIISYAFAAAGEEMAPSILSEMRYRGKNRLELEFAGANNLIEESRPARKSRLRLNRPRKNKFPFTAKP